MKWFVKGIHPPSDYLMHVRCGTANTLHMLTATWSLKVLLLWLAIAASQKHRLEWQCRHVLVCRMQVTWRAASWSAVESCKMNCFMLNTHGEGVYMLQLLWTVNCFKMLKGRKILKLHGQNPWVRTQCYRFASVKRRQCYLHNMETTEQNRTNHWF